MAPRRSRKVVKVPKNNVYTDLTLNKIMCPICRTILIEPVTLPCNHNFCLSCFDSTMANANLVCPLCRIRVGSWYRTAKKFNNLVNTELWKAIKEQFAAQVKNKLDGVDEIFDDEDQPLIKLATPGEIRKEYEKQKEADEAELKKQRDLESKASEELIKKLTAEDEFELSVAEEKVRVDREIAKQISKNLWSEAGPSKATTTTTTKQKQGPLDRFVRRRKKDVVKEAEISDSSDCIESECRYFKPIDYKNIPPSQAMSPIRVPAKIATNGHFGLFQPPKGGKKLKRSPMRSAFIVFRCSSMNTNENTTTTTTTSITRNNRRNGSMCIESTASSTITKVTKRPSIRSDEVIIASKRAKKSPSPRRLRARRPSKQQPERPVSPPCYGFSADNANTYFNKHCQLINNNWESVEEQEELEKKRQQEEADLEFAKKLQVELNGYGRYTTRLGCNKRQLTLDELIKAQCRIGL